MMFYVLFLILKFAFFFIFPKQSVQSYDKNNADSHKTPYYSIKRAPKVQNVF